MIRTGQILADLANSAGYEVVGIDLFRTRLATATKEQLREEVVLLRWPGPRKINYWSQPDPYDMILKEGPAKMSAKDHPANALTKKASRYSAIIEKIFFSKYVRGMREITFEREEMANVVSKLGIKLPKNLGDLIYSFRYRAMLPEKIAAVAGVDEIWIIRPSGRGRYRFALVKNAPIIPNELMAITKIPDATPGIVTKGTCINNFR
jgi:hypothetical protein